jgi:hypothetical protein
MSVRPTRPAPAARRRSTMTASRAAAAVAERLGIPRKRAYARALERSK